MPFSLKTGSHALVDVMHFCDHFPLALLPLFCCAFRLSSCSTGGYSSKLCICYIHVHPSMHFETSASLALSEISLIY